MEALVRTLPVRERPVWRVAREPGTCNLTELLAAVIGGPRQVESAMELLAHFGSLQALSQATATELAAVDGLGPARAAALAAAFELGRRAARETALSWPALTTTQAAAAFFAPGLAGKDQEHLQVALLTVKFQPLGPPVDIYRGSVDTALVRTAEVFRPAIRANAPAIMVAHNHPSGDPNPSPEDVALTRNLLAVGKLLDIELVDHLILGSEGRYCSLRARGLGFDDGQ